MRTLAASLLTPTAPDYLPYQLNTGLPATQPRRQVYTTYAVSLTDTTFAPKSPYISMSSSRKRPSPWTDLTMTPTTAPSAETSPLSSPRFSRTQSAVSNDERTPLLGPSGLSGAGRSRIRVQSALDVGNNPKPRLSRHASFNGSAPSALSHSTHRPCISEVLS